MSIHLRRPCCCTSSLWLEINCIVSSLRLDIHVHACSLFLHIILIALAKYQSNLKSPSLAIIQLQYTRKAAVTTIVHSKAAVRTLIQIWLKHDWISLMSGTRKSAQPSSVIGPKKITLVCTSSISSVMGQDNHGSPSFAH